MSDIDSLVNEAISAEPGVSPVATRAVDDFAVEDPINLPPQNGNGQASNQPVEVPPAESIFGTQELFDPLIHCTDEHGNPVRTKLGKFRRKRQAAASYSGGRVLDTDNVRLQKAAASARAVVQSLFLLGHIIGGDEWQPIVDEKQGINEPAVLTQAYTEFFLTCDDVEIPPWLGIVIATGGYAIPRLTAPKTRTRLQSFWSWLSSWWTGNESVAQNDPISNGDNGVAN